MIKYIFDDELNLAQKINSVGFDCNFLLKFEGYRKDGKTQKIINSLINKYDIVNNLHRGLIKGLEDFETRKGERMQNKGKISGQFTIDYIGSKHIQTIESLQKNLEELYGLGSYKDFEFHKDEWATRLYLADMSKGKSKAFKISEESISQQYIRQYITLLFLTKKDRLFWCIELASMDINIVDSGNLHHHMKSNAHIVLPVEEAFYRGELKSSKYDTLQLYLKKEFTYHNADKNDEHAKILTPYGKDVTQLRAEHPYIGAESMLDRCREWLDDSRTHKIEIQNKRTHWLVKPTIKNDNIDQDIRLNTNSFGKIEIKKHTVGDYLVKHIEYSPTYFVYKSGKK